MNTRETAEQLFEVNKNNGFWDDPNRNEPEILMLIITEAAEAVDAHRENRFAELDKFYTAQSIEGIDFSSNFKAFVKDSYADEMADIAIRILDYVEGKFSSEEKAYFYQNCTLPNVGLAHNQTFAEAMLKITNYISKLYDDLSFYQTDHRKMYISLAFAGVLSFANVLGIDLPTHIELKVKYNATRGYKHQKAY